MTYFINFIITNKRLILEVVILVTFVIVFILRKPSKNTIIDNSATFKLIELIQEAEAKFGQGHGDDKLRFVIEAYCKAKGILINRDIWVMIKVLIEKILSTPQKKGGQTDAK